MENRRKFLNNAGKATTVAAASVVGLGCSDPTAVQTPQFAKGGAKPPQQCDCTQLSVLENLQNQITGLNNQTVSLNQRISILEAYHVSGSGS